MACLLSQREIVELEGDGDYLRARRATARPAGASRSSSSINSSETDVLPKGYLFGEWARLWPPSLSFARFDAAG
jgi:hypothetical protein